MWNFSSLVGIPPGKIIAYELKKRNLSQREIARKLNLHSQTLNAVIKNRRDLTIEMALKLEKEFNMQEGELLFLQTFYAIHKYKEHNSLENKKEHPNIRRVLFWDTDYKKLDWEKQKDFIIKRVRERGNKEEIAEIDKYYHLEKSSTTI